MEIKTPFLLINLKSYREGLGENAIELAKIASKISKELGVSIGLCPQFVDLKEIAKNFDLPVFAQHVDKVSAGAFTGHVTAESVKQAGAVGTLLNHSERKINLGELGEYLALVKKAGLVSVVCAANLEEVEKIVKFEPEFIAYEPPELIGTGIPVSKSKPEIVRKSVELVKNFTSKTKVLCGAGISSGEDVKKALELRAEGVLVASAIVKAKEREKIVREMANALL